MFPAEHNDTCLRDTARSRPPLPSAYAPPHRLLTLPSSLLPSPPLPFPLPSFSPSQEEHIGRPNKSEYSADSTDGAAQWADTTNLYCSLSDGSEQPVERWVERQFPRMKEAVGKIWGAFTVLHESRKALAEAPGYREHHKRQIKCGNNPVPTALAEGEGRLQVMGFDFMIDDDDRPWLLEINSVCNLKTSATCALDLKVKRNLAQVRCRDLGLVLGLGTSKSIGTWHRYHIVLSQSNARSPQLPPRRRPCPSAAIGDL